MANKITRLDPKTGEMKDFPIPFTGTAGVHSAVPAPDGSVWLAEQGSNKLGRWDPVTQKITEYQDAYLPGKEGIEDGGSKHTVRIDPSGKVWASGVPLTRFDPETEKFTASSKANTPTTSSPTRMATPGLRARWSTRSAKWTGKR